MSLRDQIFDDIDGVFLNADDFAEEAIVNIGGKDYQVMVVQDDDTLLERTDAAAQGTYLGEKLIFIKAADIPGRPAVGARITLNGESYFVTNCVNNFGMYEIRMGANRT